MKTQEEKNRPQDISYDGNNILQQLLSMVGSNSPANTMKKANELDGETEKQRLENKFLQDQIKSNPITKATYKAVEEATTRNVQEAISAGMPPQDILAQALKMANIQPRANAQPGANTQPGVYSSQPSQQPVNNVPPATQQPQQESLSKYYPKSAGGPLNTLFNLIGFGDSPELMNAKVNHARAAQEMSGNQPIQPSTILTQNVELAKSKASIQAARYQAIVGQENSISEQYVKDFEPLKLATDSVGKITAIYEDSLKNPNNNINDFFLVYNAIKAADPNAVKEGEYKTVQELMPLARKVLNFGSFAVKGENLDSKQRQSIIRAAVTQYNGLAKRFEPLHKEYESRVSSYGGDPKRALVNYGAKGNASSGRISAIEAEMKRRGI